MRINRGLLILLVIVGLGSGVPWAMAAGSDPIPTTDPADQAAAAYNRGIESRDKAWELEEQAAASSDSKLE